MFLLTVTSCSFHPLDEVEYLQIVSSPHMTDAWWWWWQSRAVLWQAVAVFVVQQLGFHPLTEIFKGLATMSRTFGVGCTGKLVCSLSKTNLNNIPAAHLSEILCLWNFWLCFRFLSALAVSFSWLWCTQLLVLRVLYCTLGDWCMAVMKIQSSIAEMVTLAA